MAAALGRAASPRSPPSGSDGARGTAAGRPAPLARCMVLCTPKGWTGPREVDGVPVEGTWRAHQVPLAGNAGRTPSTGPNWRRGCARYRPEELFDEHGTPLPELHHAARRKATHRMSANPHANGGQLLRDLRLPDFTRLRHRRRGARRCDRGRPRATLGHVARATSSGRTRAPSASSARTRPPRTACRPCSRPPTGSSWAPSQPTDEHVAQSGRVVEVLSEHLCQGWLEGYLLTGRHGLFNCYEAFIHIVDAMFNQHAKWLEDQPPHPVAATGGLVQLPALQPRVAPGPQRLLPPGPRVPRPRPEQEARDRAGLPAPGRQHPAGHDGPLPAHPRHRQRRRRGQEPGPALAVDGRGDRALHARHRHLGLGLLGRGHRARMWCWDARATCRPSRCWRRSPCCEGICPS